MAPPLQSVLLVAVTPPMLTPILAPSLTPTVTLLLLGQTTVDKDVSRLVVEKTAASVERLRSRMKTLMPYGPTKVKMNSREARRFLQNMQPATQEILKQRMGVAEWDAMMERLYGNT